MNKIEVLAPAGNLESFLTAINNGADAIYLGLNDFNARGNIENFTCENIEEVVKKAHLFGVKVYLTLNILIQDSEIEEVLQIARKAIDSKVDAFIVQDIGLAHLLSNTFDGIELHASTQMGLQNYEGVKFVQKIGYSRVVLARETPLNEIKRIKENSDVEIEYFVQGALCVAFSGNCYLCSLHAGASGNRGKCKQFCRLPWELNKEGKEVKNGYLLSTKDFCNLSYLKELTESGVTSLKIEGRARRPAYVGGAVSIYRKAVDQDFKFEEKDIDVLKRLFNRGGYISGYFKDDKIIYSSAQNHIGVQIGGVSSFKPGKKFNEIIISSNHEIKRGDSLKFFEKGKEIASINVFDVKDIGQNKYSLTSTTKVPAGSAVHLIVDSGLENEILNKKKKIEVYAFMEAKANQRAKLYLRVDQVEVVEESDQILQASISQPLTHEECEKQISKLGEDYILKEIKCDLDNVFIRKSSLNELRRKAVVKLEEKIIKNNEKNIKIQEKTFKLNKKDKKNNKNIYIFDNLNELNNQFDLNNYFIYSPLKYEYKEIFDFCENNKEKIIYLDMPVIVTRADIQLFEKLFKNCSNLGIYATNYYCFSLTTPEKTIISPELNVFNSYAVDFYLKHGYDKIVLSKEFFDFDKIITQNAEIFMLCQTRQRLMYFKHCPFKEHIGGSCADCKYKDGLSYKLDKKKFLLKRKKAVNCQFYLVDDAFAKQSVNDKFGKVFEM